MIYALVCFSTSLTVLKKLRSLKDFLNLFQPIVTFHIETSHMIYPVHQMTGFDMKYNTGLKGVNVLRNFEVE